LDSASKELRSLAAAVRMASQSVNGLAAVDQQATCVVSPAPGVPPAPFTAPEVVATGAPANAVTKAQASLDPQ
jgi:hypothetical protein